MDKEDVLRERINSLIDNGLLSVEMLQEATGIEKDSLEKFLFENGVKLSTKICNMGMGKNYTWVRVLVFPYRYSGMDID